jgi:hypothetical protein
MLPIGDNPIVAVVLQRFGVVLLHLLGAAYGTLSPFAAARRFSPLSEELLPCRRGDHHASS